jgi:hypothetical protein
MSNDDKILFKNSSGEEIDCVEINKKTRKKAGRKPGTKNKNWEYKQKIREQEKAKKKLYKKGVFHPFVLNDLQMDLYNDYRNGPDQHRSIWSLSRQIGKSWTVCTIALEEATRNPGIRMAYIAPEMSDAVDITEQTFDQLADILGLDDSSEYIPKYNSKRNRWDWDNGSFLKITGTDNKRYKKIRGRSYERLFLDEFCFYDDFRTVLYSCIEPTLTSVPDHKVIFISTPPETPDHESNMILDVAEEDGVIIKRTLFDCPRLTKDQKQKIIDKYRPLGGVDSVEFRREYMVERIPDITKLVLPEVNPELMAKIVADVPKPEYFNTLEAFDWGVLDNNAGLFAYINFDQQVLVIEDEMFLDGVHFTTEDIARDIRAKEMENWGHNDHSIQRCCDNNLQIINDMCVTYGLPMYATAKHDRSSAIMHVRKLIANGQILINPRCVNLIEQIQSATWANAKKREFSRRNGHHYDLVAALIYLVRNANLTVSPYPVNYDVMGKDPNSYFKREKSGRISEDAKVLKNMFTIKKRRK